jgi:ComF family protein
MGTPDRLWEGPARMAGLALDALLPPLCLSCASAVDRPGSLCAACWQRISFIEGPACSGCGLPFEFEVGAGALCGACIAHPPAYRRARAVLRYDAHSRDLILKFKHADRLHGAPAFGIWLARAGAEILADADLLAPVPLHRRRLWTRRYNQAALLAQAAGKAAVVPVVTDLLRRNRHTVSQGGLSPAQRSLNVRGAFALRRGREHQIGGRNVVLVDDVLTTGATVEACARTLTRAGAAAVDVLTLARVVRLGR